MDSQTFRGPLRARGLFGRSSIAFLFVVASGLAAAQTPTAPISVDITAVPPGADTMRILKDKQDCDSSSHYDARLFVQCMQGRGYSLAVYGPDHKRTSIDDLYSGGPPSAERPQAQQARQAPQVQQPAPEQSNPSAITSPADSHGPGGSARQADIRAATEFWARRAAGTRPDLVRSVFPQYAALLDDPNANGKQASWGVRSYLVLVYANSDPVLANAYHLTVSIDLPLDTRIAGLKRIVEWDEAAGEPGYAEKDRATLADLERTRQEMADRAAPHKASASSASDLEGVMQYCSGALSELNYLIDGEKNSIASQVSATLWPQGPTLQTDPANALKGMVAILGGTYSKGAELFQEQNTPGEARRVAQRGGEFLRKLIVDEKAADKAVALFRKCDAEKEELANKLDW
jgi:hypothetical protein